MSRIPQPSRSPAKPQPTPAKSRLAPTANPSRIRTQSRAATPTKPPTSTTRKDSVPASLSIKEAIALRRAEAKKAQAKGSSTLDDFAALEDALPPTANKQEDEDILGRWPVRESIERARSTGSLNLATRSLPCIPSALFEIHLGITPDPLESVPDEPPLPSPDPAGPLQRGGKRDAPSWFEAQDLQTFKIWNNDITEVQHEISLFGSLKTIDLHKNKLVSLPATFGDLMALTVLDLSHNALTTLPTNLFALPELTTLNISHNALTALPFNAPFASTKSISRQKQSTGGSFFTPIITRASTPLPRLLALDASHNKIPVDAVDLQIPAALTKFDLSANPLGIDSRPLLRALGALQKLKELRFEKAEIGDDTFTPTLFSSAPFPSLRLLDLGQTEATPGAVKAALKGMKQELSYDATIEEPPEGIVCIIVGKKIIKERWELESERRAKARSAKQADAEVGYDWDIKPLPPSSTRTETNKPRPEVVKEAWEIEAEQGLLTEGGKRRARAAAAAAAAAERNSQSALGNGTPLTSATNHSPSQSISGLSLSSPQYFSPASQTLTLPPSTPPSKSPAHTRAFSLAASSPSASTVTRPADIAVPAPTLPLSTIATQPFAHTLKVLVLTNRRMDRTFALPAASVGREDAWLPCLEELNLEGCGLPDVVAVTRSDAAPRGTEPLLPLVARLFPNLRTLNLSYNALTSASLTREALGALVLASPERKGGLRHLRLRGNRISELDGLQGLAAGFKGNREVPGWGLDELDLRDNEIGKLPPELGLLPMDVFLVDGNIFRVPQRRVWEREGTKGLLGWLRGRIE